MKTLRIALFAAAATISLAASTHFSPAAAGNLDFLGNENYMRCLKYVSGLAKGDAAAYDRGRRTCNRAWYPGHKGYDY